MIQIIYDGILYQDMLKLSIIIRNHKCSKCQNIDQIINCIYKQIARNLQESKDLQQIILLNAYHFALEKPIQSIIYLLRQYDHCDLYHKIAYQQAILKCHEYIEERCQITIKSPNSSLNDSNEQAKRCLQLADKILTQQQDIWTQFSKGLQTIDQYIHLITKMYKQISYYDEIMRKIEKDKTRDIQQLKLLQLYYGLIQYNPKQVSIIEQQIQDQMKIDRYKIEVTLNSLVIFENRYIMLRMSMINNRGQLINPNLRLLKQFLECDKEIDNVSIIDLMPKAIANVHDNFIDNYIHRGYSSLTQSQTTIHFQRQNGFILSAQLSVDHIQNLTEDFIITSLAIKPHSNPQLILISENGQIIGMDESVFQIINSLNNHNIQIEEIINHGALIHIFIKNIAQSLQLLLRDYNNTGQTIIYDINDFWNFPKNYKQLIRQSNEIVQTTNEDIDSNSIPLFNQLYNQQLENLSIQQSQNRNQVNYHLSFLTYKHNNGQFVMFQLQVNDHNQEHQVTKHTDIYDKTLIPQKPQSLLIQSNKSSSNYDSISEDDVVIANPMDSNEFRFMNSFTKRQLVSCENAQEAELQQFMEKSNNGLTDHLNQVLQLSPKKRAQKNNNQNIESIHSKSASSSSKEDDHILRKISEDKSIIKPLLYASVLLFFILLSLELLIILNINLISSNINDQIEQIKVLMQPQNINYAYSSIITQMMFQYMKDSNIIKMSDFMYTYNKESIQIAQQYCQQYITPLCITLPLYQAQFGQTTFNQSFLEFGQLTSSIEPIEQINFKMLSNILSLINDTRYDLISSKGFIRQNIEVFSMDLDFLIVSLRKQTQSDQLQLKNNLAIYLLIQLLVIVILFIILYVYIHKLDEITVDMITVSCRISMFQAQEQIFKIQQSQKALTFNFMSKNIWDNLFEGFKPQTDTKDVEQSRLLYSKLPQKRYYDKSNILIILIQFIAYLTFFSIGLGIYYQQVDTFLPGIASTLNFIRFRHNFDTVLLFGALIKMDSWILNNNLSYLNQSRIIQNFNNYSSDLSIQLNMFIENIYSSQLQNDEQFSDLLFENLCNTYNLTCCYIKPGNANYSQYDDFSNLISHGIVGYTEEIHKYFNQDFYNEIQSLQYQKTSIDNQQFQNIFLSYFTEVQDIMQSFLLLFIEQNHKMAESIISVTQNYYLVVGNLLLLCLIIFQIVWIKVKSTKIHQLCQMIGIIPVSISQAQNQRQLILRIFKKLF
ncbi:hypothetical protein pb186bvf_007431 [Paramecium bursaria]